MNSAGDESLSEIANSHDISASDVCTSSGAAAEVPCTLRAAIEQANAHAGGDIINFNIGEGGPATITVSGTSLPAIAEPLTIDGTTQPGDAVQPLIELTWGGGGETAGLGLQVSTHSTLIKGLAITGFGTGVQFDGSGPEQNQIRDSFIGTANGTDAKPNTFGIRVFSCCNLIGPDNVISGNTSDGILITGSGASGNQVLTNLIGTTSTGDGALGNNAGLSLQNGTTGNLINANTFAANQIGIVVQAPDNRIMDNEIGLDGLGNVSHGIQIHSDDTIVGVQADGTGLPNRIVGNGADGVQVLSGLRNRISNNVIRDNGGLGIELLNEGVTSNDEDDTDTGPNNLINFPTLILSGDDVTADFDGYPPDINGATVAVELFQVSSCDPSGFGEGDAFFAQQSAPADTQGDVVVTFPDLPAGTYTATATAGGNTSEFSECVTLEAAPTGPVLYGVDSGTDRLSLIDPDSGNVTLVGALDPEGGATTPVAMGVHPVTGELYVWNNSPTGVLLIVDPDTGLATQVNADTPDQGALQALAFARDGTLYGLDSDLFTIDPSSGVRTHVAALESRIAGADVGPDGLIYGAGFSKNLVTIAPDGSVTPIGTLTTEEVIDLGVIGSIVFTPECGLLGSSFGATLADESTGSIIFDIDPATGAVSNVQPLNGAGPQGMGFSDPCDAAPSGTVALQHAVADTAGTLITGRVEANPSTTAPLTLVTGSSCVDGVLGETQVVVGESEAVTTDVDGNHFFVNLPISHSNTVGAYVAASFGGGELSDCIIAGPNNDSWVRALTVNSSTFDGFVDAPGRSRWYKFPIPPGAEVRVSLSGLPADYNLALFRDIQQVFARIAGVDTQEELTELSAEFAPDMFSPDMFSPDMFSPDMFSPDMFSPDMFSPDMFSPDMFSPDMFSPDMFSPDMFSPDMFSPDMYSPDMFSPDMFSPDMFSPDMFSPDMFSPENFVAAQIFSLIGFSGEKGTTDELIIRNTWNNTGNFYVRVSGRNAAFDTSTPFQGNVQLNGNLCVGVNAIGTAPGDASGAGVETIILWDPGRIEGTTAEKDALATKLQSLAGRSEVDGVVIDLSSNTRVQDLHIQADGKPACVYAKNLVAQGIKDVVDSYRANNTLKYVVLVGDDHSIPFFRYGDQAGLAPESNYYPPVTDSSTSQAALRLNYILGQDEYGSRININRGTDVLPLPDLAVGRLVETAAEASGIVDAYLGDSDGVVGSSSYLATGYDFLTDAATAISTELAGGTGSTGDELISPAHLAPTDPLSWTADDLRNSLLASGRHDLIFLAGHFSAFSSLAADYSTRMLTTELIGSSVDMSNSIIFSAGCHSGYGIVDEHAIPLVTQPLDWAQAFAQKKATFIGGTGYQYGDTDFIEYSEEIYLNFAKELRQGTGAVSVGEALVRAKQEYLASTPSVHGLHRKSLVISTIFGLPMLSVDMAKVSDPGDSSSVGTNTFESGPASVLGTEFANLTLEPSSTQQTVTLQKLVGGAEEPFELTDLEPLTATYYEGPDGVVANPGQPVVPLMSENVTVSGQVLRGVGFRGGNFTESTVNPLTGAPTTEIRGVHSDFPLPLFFPMRLATVNYFGELTGTGGTRLHVTPAQHKASNSSTLRLYSDVDLRLYYSNNTSTFGPGTPALAAPPTISQVSADTSGNVQVRVVGDPFAGIQEVWITHSDGSSWSSTDLVQDPVDSRLWAGTLPAGATEFIVQAVNGVGLVTMSDNFGQYYTIQGLTVAENPQVTTLAVSGPSSGTFGDTISVSATLGGTSDVSGKSIRFSLGGSSRTATTDASGTATANLRLVATPGNNELKASFAGDETLAASSDSAPFTINKAPTTLTIEPNPDPVAVGGPTGYTAILRGGNGEPLKERTVFFTLTNPDFTTTIPVITDFAGRAPLGSADFPTGVYTVEAHHLGEIPLPSGTLSLSDPVYLPSDDLYEYLVVYDPSAGFVTGGGWIDSPAGAYVADPDLTGKASFGFVAKYKKGQTTPSGNTQFQFKAGDLNFYSVDYEWLVVSGSGHKGQFKGTGTINGSGNYGFILTAIDGDNTSSTEVDLFRIKIWDKDDGDAVVYDNDMSSPDNADPTTAIAGGSIVIHSGKSSGPR